MTPAARISAAIDILDTIQTGNPVEKTLTNWARGNRYAGSSDRAAIRDHVFEVMRRKRSVAWRGRGDSGRAMMIGLLAASGIDPNTLFTGEKYAPAALEDDEQPRSDLAAAPRAVQLDCPDWLLGHFDQSLGGDVDAVLQKLQNRAPVFLRVNTAKSDMETARDMLAADGIVTARNALAETALEVLENPRRVRQNAAYLGGHVELQDAGSQAVIAELPLRKGQTLLDYCAGGGGKSLALASHEEINVSSCDIDVKRLADLPERARRAGANIAILSTEQLAGQTFDLVLCDAPCSGSGAWRRAPDAKWSLTVERLQELVDIQRTVLDRAVGLTAAHGAIAYVTCSVFQSENQSQIDEFVTRHKGWSLEHKRSISPLEGGDGFYVAILRRGTIT